MPKKRLIEDSRPAHFGFDGAGIFLTCGQSLPSFGDDVTERFDKVGIVVKDPLHRVMSDFQHFSFLDGNDARGSRFAGEEGHLSEEGTFAQGCDGARPTVLGNLDVHSAVVHHEH